MKTFMVQISGCSNFLPAYTNGIDVYMPFFSVDATSQWKKYTKVEEMFEDNLSTQQINASQQCISEYYANGDYCQMVKIFPQWKTKKYRVCCTFAGTWEAFYPSEEYAKGVAFNAELSFGSGNPSYIVEELHS
jgi:hypothetical protein